MLSMNNCEEAIWTGREQIRACGKYLASHADDILPSTHELIEEESLRITLEIDPRGLPCIKTSRTIFVLDK